MSNPLKHVYRYDGLVWFVRLHMFLCLSVCMGVGVVGGGEWV